MKKIVFAGGCFWGVQKYMDSIEGVLYTNVGYANGNTEKPTYEEVCNDNTGYAEAVKVEYDETKISLVELLEKYWRIIDPTTKNRQKMDIGSQYRSGIYYLDEVDRDIIIQSRDKEQEKHELNIVTEIKKIENFHEAEEYHQKYLEKNPNGYCHLDFSDIG